MATLTLAAADPVLKDYYVGPIIEQINYKTFILDQIKRDSDSIDATGRRAIIPVHARDNRGRGSRGDNANLPIAGYDVDVDAIIGIKYHYYAIEVSDPAKEASTRSEGAFVNLLERQTKGVAKSMRKDVNRMVWGLSNGLLSQLRAISSGTTVQVTSAQYIKVGDPVDVLDTTTGAATLGVQNAIVTARDVTAGANTITLDTALAGSATTSYGVYISGNRNNEMEGIQNIINTSRTLHSINSATAGNEFWNAGSRKNASSNVAGETLFEQVIDEVGAGGNGDVDVFVTTRGIRRRLADTYQSQKRFNDARATTINGGYTAIYVNEVPVVADDDAPKGFAWGINKDSFRWVQQTPPGWMESKDGTIFHLKDGTVSGTKMNVWQAWFRWYANLANTAPNRNGVIFGADDDAAT